LLNFCSVNAVEKYFAWLGVVCSRVPPNSHTSNHSLLSNRPIVKLEGSGFEGLSFFFGRKSSV
jgi:hypothetical protein